MFDDVKPTLYENLVTPTSLEHKIVYSRPLGDLNHTPKSDQGLPVLIKLTPRPAP